MSSKAEKHVFKSGTSSVFIGRATGHSSVSWRLDVRDTELTKRRMFNTKNRLKGVCGRAKLFHYISAGGMRQLRRTSGDDLAEARRRAFLRFVCAMVILWVVFYVLPFA